MAAPLLLDLRDLGINHKGVGRVLEGLAPRLVDLAPDRYHVVTTAAGVSKTAFVGPTRRHITRSMPQALWEQVGLPFVARRIGASAVYSHRECGALWGSPLLLHVTEDPEVRWTRDPPTDVRGRLRRAYSSRLMARSLSRASVGASTAVVADELAADYAMARSAIEIIPLAVDHRLFRPVPGDGAQPYFFHLASGDPRDGTGALVEAYGAYCRESPDPGRLVVGGDLGVGGPPVQAQVRALGLSSLVSFTGRLTDEDLVRHYSGALATVQPSSDEGFGLQPLEAAACGGLLIAGSSPAVDEVMEGAVVLWTDGAVPSLVTALTRAASDGGLRREAAAQNVRHASTFTWGRTADIVHRKMIGMAV